MFETTSSLAVTRYRSPHSTRPPASLVTCSVSRCTLPFLRGVPLRLENGGAGQRRSSTHGYHPSTSTTPYNCSAKYEVAVRFSCVSSAELCVSSAWGLRVCVSSCVVALRELCASSCMSSCVISA